MTSRYRIFCNRALLLEYVPAITRCSKAACEAAGNALLD